MHYNAKRGEAMSSAPRYTHSFSLNQEDENKLQEALKKIKIHSGGKYGLIDIVMIGINRWGGHRKNRTQT